MVNLSINLSIHPDTTKQQPDFRLSLIKPDPEPFKFKLSGGRNEQSSNSHQHHGFGFPGMITFPTYSLFMSPFPCLKSRPDSGSESFP